jgi:hypothetical protein
MATSFSAASDLRLLDAFWREPVERTVLPNGLTLIIKRDPSAALASVQVWVKTGSIHENAHLGAGLSHYLEHMLFKGTERRAGREGIRAKITAESSNRRRRRCWAVRFGRGSVSTVENVGGRSGAFEVVMPCIPRCHPGVVLIGTEIHGQLFWFASCWLIASFRSSYSVRRPSWRTAPTSQ